MLPQSCPEPARLKDLLDGTLPEPEQSALSAHLEACAACQQTVEGLAAGRDTWAGAGRLADAGSNPPAAALQQVMDEVRDAPDVTQTHIGSASAVELPADFLAPPDEPGHLGKLDHFEVFEVVGHGAFGIVLRAFDQKLHRVVAIKVMSPQLATSATARRRFVREAQAAAPVCHEHVVAIHAVEESHALPYIVMQFVGGVSLQDRLDRSGPLQVREVLRIGMQAAAGLAAAHKQGLVHRDIKPSNILLENGVERVKITDFGLARAVDDASLTQTGVIAGTPQFMAPEQARGEAIDHRADLFSLGSVLYALCAGRPPFRASSTMAVLKRVCEESPRPLRELNLEIPDWLAAIIDRLLAKDPADRFQSAQEVSELLAQHLAHLQQPDRAPMPAAPNSTRVADKPAVQEIRPQEKADRAASPAPATGRPVGPLTMAVIAAAILGLIPLATWLGSAGVLSAGAAETMRTAATGLGVMFVSAAGLIALVQRILRGTWRGSILGPPLTAATNASRNALPRRPANYTLRLVVVVCLLILGGPLLLACSAGLAWFFSSSTSAPSSRVRIDDPDRTSSGDGIRKHFPATTTTALEGRWIVASQQTGGVQLPRDLTSQWLEFRGGGFRHSNEASRISEARFEIDEQVEPHRIQVFSGSDRSPLQRGIWRIDDERLTICLAPGNEPLPREFRTRRNSGAQLYVCRPAQDDLSELQGRWIAVSQHVDGKVRSTEAGEHAWTISADRLQREGPSGEFRLEVETGADPKQIDFYNGELHAYSGIYRREGDRLFVYRGLTGNRPRTLPRPAVASKDAGPGTEYYEFRRAGSDIDKLQGRWKLSSAHGDVKVHGDLFLEIRGDMLQMTTGEGESFGEQRFVVDSSANPKSLDYFVVGRPEATARGIYRIDDETLTITLGSATKRPDDFSAPSGSGRVVWVWRRVKAGTAAAEIAASDAGAESASNSRWSELQDYAITETAMTRDGRWLFTGGEDGSIRKWNIESGRSVRPFPGHERPIQALAVSRDGTWLLSGDETGRIFLWDAVQGGAIRELRGHTGRVQGLAFLGDGKRAVSCSADWAKFEDASVRMWNVETGEEIRRFECPHRTNLCVAVSPDDRYVLVGGQTGVATLFETATGRPLRTLAGSYSDVPHVAFHPDGRRAITTHLAESKVDGIWDDAAHCVIRLWDVETGQELSQFRGHRGGVLHATLSSDGRHLVSCSSGQHDAAGVFLDAVDKTVRVWDVETARELCAFDHQGVVRSVAFGAAGRTVLGARQQPAVGGPVRRRHEIVEWPLPENVRPSCAPAIAPFPADLAREYQQRWSEQLGVPVEFANSIGMKLRLIPAGEFDMGTSDEELDRLTRLGKGKAYDEHFFAVVPTEAPQHHVRLSRPYYIAAHEVTVGPFRAFVEETGYKTTAETDGKGGGTFDGSKFVLRPETNWKVPGIIQGSDRHPVTQVTWNDAQQFCRWLSKKEGRSYRLPTEAEWEFACRAGTTTPYACGETLTPRDADYEGSTVPVGSFRPNAFGLHEMHSNVMEWCADYFGHRAYVHSEPVDPTGPVEGTKRVHRSGSWGDFPEKCRSASRGGYEPDYRHYGLGFRVVCDVSAKVTGEIAADDGTRVTLEQLVALARAKLDRNRKLHEMSSVSTMELAESEIELKNAEIRLATAKGDRKGVLSLLEELVKLRQANLDRARRLVEKNALAKADEAEFEKALTEDRFRLEQARKEAAAP